MNFLTKIINKQTSDYIKHNNKFFKKKKSNNKILVEFNAFHSTHVAFSYLSNVLAEKYEASIQPFFNYTILSSPLFPSFIQKLKWFLSKKLNLFNHKVYKSFGSLNCMKPKINSKNISEAKKIKKKLFENINKKDEVLDIFYKNILVGDLLYDTYLKSKNKPTIDLNSNEFHNFCGDFFALCDFWIDYFENNSIEAVITSHSVYSYAIPLRIAVYKNIKAYGCTSRHINKLNKLQFRMHANANEYEKIFNSLDQETKEKGIKLAKETLQNRIQGNIDTSAGFFGNVKVSPFNKMDNERQINKSDKIKVLILPHDFFDAVHIYGKGIFPDFYEWLNFLGSYSKKNNINYEWFIKLRPDYKGKYVHYHGITENIVNDFLKNNPHIKKISNNYSLHQIKKEEMDFVLTVHGTAALEFPLIKGPSVINASANNPHSYCQFSISPKNLSEYKDTLDNLSEIKKSKKETNLDEIYRYYFIRHFYNDKNWLTDQNKLIEFLGLWEKQFSEKFYLYWIKNFTENNHNKIISRLKKFLESHDRNINITIK